MKNSIFLRMDERDPSNDLPFPSGSDIEFDEWAAWLSQRFRRFLGSALQPSTFKAIGQLVHSDLQELSSMGSRVLVKDWGLEVAGAVAKSSRANANSLRMEWQTRWPIVFGGRYHPEPNDAIILGHYNDYDLYLAPQIAIGHTLMARNGNHEHYTTWNPKFVGSPPPEGTPLHEAYQRALFLGYADYF